MFLSSAADDARRDGRRSTNRQILAAEIRLLYTNTRLAVAVTVAAATVLAYLQWEVVSHPVILGWWLYMFLISAARLALTSVYSRTAAGMIAAIGPRWRAAITSAAGLAGAGWGAAGIVLYPEADLGHQVLLVFVLGGMMLGASSLLAPRPETFLAFLIPAGLGPTVRLIIQGGHTHVGMGFLAGVFTVAVIVTTWRLHRAVESALGLQFQNQDLVEHLQAAKTRTEELNQQLELRVQERTAELHDANERLVAEIARRERMEEELLRARKLESLGVLAGGIAHDFNNFLTIVQGNVEMLRMRLVSGEPVEEILDQVASACQRAAFLSTQLLTFAKGGDPVRRVISVARLVMDAVHLGRAGAPVSIDVKIADDLWPVDVDSGQIGQVLHNVLLNARQAMPEGGKIEVRAENVPENLPGSGRGVRISIRDQGIGIPADVLPRIFDPYFTTKPRGSGLGLATSYAIVAKHGGQIAVESKPGEGTVFTIFLPASQDRPAPESPAGAGMQSGTERLLIMDDEEPLRKLLESILTKIGYEVQSARDGAEAIALFQAAKAAGRGFDAVLLDLTVPGGMGGVEAASRLRNLDGSVKLIVSSGYSDAAVMSDVGKYGFDAMIPKPWSAAELSEVLRRVLGSNRESSAN